MKCAEVRQHLSSYLDDALTPHEHAIVDAHLDVCPFCRLRLNEMRLVVRRLASVARPVPPADLRASIINAVSIERAAQEAQITASISASIARWLRPRVMPYTIGMFASLLLFFTVASALRPHMATLRSLAIAAREEPVSPNDVMWFKNNVLPLTPENYAASRNPFSSESPSLNPNGALAALVSNPLNHHDRRIGDDDMVFVADVNAQGDARLTEIIQPPRDKRMLRELRNALRQTPAFVPAALDNRPETMRVVFVMEKINVKDQAF